MFLISRPGSKGKYNYNLQGTWRQQGKLVIDRQLKKALKNLFPGVSAYGVHSVIARYGIRHINYSVYSKLVFD